MHLALSPPEVQPHFYPPPAPETAQELQVAIVTSSVYTMAILALSQLITHTTTDTVGGQTDPMLYRMQIAHWCRGIPILSCCKMYYNKHPCPLSRLATAIPRSPLRPTSRPMSSTATLTTGSSWTALPRSSGRTRRPWGARCSRPCSRDCRPDGGTGSSGASSPGS